MKIQTTQQYDGDIDNIFYTLSIEMDLEHFHYGTWEVGKIEDFYQKAKEGVPSLGAPSKVYSSTTYERKMVFEEEDMPVANISNKATLILVYPEYLVEVTHERKFIHISIASKILGNPEYILDEYQEIFPVEVEEDKDAVSVNFWFSQSHGYNCISRAIEMPEWVNIKNNYSKTVRENLDIYGWKPDTGGQLILFSGPPGTGKTYSIRSLIKEWQKWAYIDYIVDPEAFLGNPNSMMSVIMRNHYESDDKWRLIIIEDGGELLSSDAKEKTGQGLSRLLNITDGMLGQGLKILVLITSNEELGKMNAAVIRPGRTAMNIKFDPLTVAEANAWLAAHDCTEKVRKETTLADLYNMIDPKQVKNGEIKKEVGFR